jgi:hypothetical protein
MKTLIALYSIVLVVHLSFTQTPIEWERSIGGSNVEQLVSIQETSDGGYIGAGSSLSNNGDLTSNNGELDFWVVKLTNTGSIDWQKSYGGSQYDAASSVQQTSDGGYIVAGLSNSTDGDVIGNQGGRDFWILKLTNTGTITWQASLGGSNNDYARSIQETVDGGFIVAGSSASIDGDITLNHGNFDFWVVKLTNTGIIDWQKSYGGSEHDGAYAIQQTTDGGYIMTGESSSNDGDLSENQGNSDYWIVKLNSFGNIDWQYSYGGSGLDSGQDVKETSNGDYIVAGYSNSNDGDITGNHGDTDYWVIKLSSTGALIWQKTVGGSDSEAAFEVQETPDGGFVVGGYSESTDWDVFGNHGYFDFWLIKLSNSGSLIFSESLGGSEIDDAFSMAHTSDGGYIMSGHSRSNDGNVTGNQGESDAWVVKLSPTLEISESSFSGLSVYPIPSAGKVIIDIGDQIKDFKVTISNSLGRIIYKNEYNSANKVNLELAGHKGVFNLQIEVEESVYSKKIILE